MTTTRTGTATMDAEAGSPAVNREEPSHALRWEVAGFLGGFGLAMLAGLDGRLVAWIVAALFAGIVLRGTLLGAWLGFVVASVALVAFDVLRADPPPAEWQGTVGVLAIVGIAGAVLVVPIGLVAWQLLAVLKGDAWFAPRARVTEIVAALLALVGGALLALSAASIVGLVSSPASASYSLTLPAGWNVIERDLTAPRDPAHGEALTAVFGTTEPPQAGAPVERPLVGVSVGRVNAPAADCLRAFEGWPGVDSDLYRGPIEESGPAELAAGAGYREVRRPEPAGTTLTAVAFSRVRTIGLIREPLCYALVITLPADSAVTEADAAEILASFRFR